MNAIGLGKARGLALALVSLLGSLLHAQTSPPVKLFNGTTLAGWKVLGNGSWSVKDGAMVAKLSASNPGFTHLIHDSVVKDFRLTFLFRSVKGNSGLFFRLQQAGGTPDNVAGVQAVIDPALASDNAFGLYETGGRLWLKKWDFARHRNQYPSPGNSCRMIRDWPELPLPDSVCRKTLYQPGDWNRLSIWARGPRLIVKLNMRTIADISDPATDRPGRFAFKLHGGQDVEIHFKDVVLSGNPAPSPEAIAKLKKVLLYKGEPASPPPLREYLKEIAADNGFLLDEGGEAAFTRENLAQYQVALFLSDYNINFNSAQKADFEAWFRSGRGAACIHACTRTEIARVWPWWGTALGASLSKHSGYYDRTLSLDREAAARPLWKGFDSGSHTWPDEWYLWRENPRGKKDITVLMSYRDAGPAGEIVPVDYPSAWISSAEAGRFFVWGAVHTMNALELPSTYDFLLKGLLDAAGLGSPVVGSRSDGLPGNIGPRVHRTGRTLRFADGSPFSVQVKNLAGKALYQGKSDGAEGIEFKAPPGEGVLIVILEANGKRNSQWVLPGLN